MEAIPSYALLDVGDERRLERFADRTVDRPAPGVGSPARDLERWRAVDLRFDRVRGWTGAAADEPWLLQLEGIVLELRPTPTGQVGCFPEQVPTWRWLRRRIAERAGSTEPVRILNLFAHTGGATLVAAAAGAVVAHVDASRPTLAWARVNALRSDLGDAPIRWLLDDALAFVRREARRGRTYDGIVLDPPSYGHGRQAWRLEADLPELLDACAAILDRPGFVALSAHTPGFGPDRLADELAAAFRGRDREIDAGPLDLTAASGALLPLGAYARWSG